MKMSRVAVLLCGATLLFSSVALAGDSNKGTLKLNDQVVVDGKPVKPGNYTVEWDGSGPAVQIKLLRGKQTVATLPAHLTEQARTSSQDAYGTSTAPDGSKSLTAIYFSGKRLALQIDRNGGGPQPSAN
ncbi:MAG: hypothetical protein ABSG16_07830 [Candidatus Acidiferrum sp.]|jgi:hypothetical protein